MVLIVGVLSGPTLSQEARQELLTRLQSFQGKLRNLRTLPLDELRELQVELRDLRIRVLFGGSEFAGPLDQARKEFERGYATRLREEARSFAAANPEKGIGALARYREAEEEIHERAVQSRAKEDYGYFESLYRGILEESDALCEAVFTPEVIARTPWMDLLSPDMAKEWTASSVEGFSWRIQRGTLDIVGPDQGCEQVATLSIGGREKWRDFVLEFDVAFEHPGNLDLFARLGRHAGQAVGMTLAVSPPDVPPAHVWTGPTLLVGEGVLRPRAPYACEVTCLGSRFRVKIGDGAPHEYEEEIRWTKSRRGSIGLVVPEGTRVTFTRMRIRVLR